MQMIGENDNGVYFKGFCFDNMLERLAEDGYVYLVIEPVFAFIGYYREKVYGTGLDFSAVIAHFMGKWCGKWWMLEDASLRSLCHPTLYKSPCRWDR